MLHFTLTLGGLFGCADDSEKEQWYVSEVYSESAHWICHPDQNPRFCEIGLDSTIVDGTGSLTNEPHQPEQPQAFDCFYVYPTVNLESAPNSDLILGEEEQQVALNQIARYSRYCEIYAPVYRQSTVPALLGGFDGDLELAYDDVLDAWKHYLANDNQGRGVLLVGHSQGADHLTRLLREEIEPADEVLPQLVAAHLIGTSIEVPSGQLVGGDLNVSPLCSSADEVGCVVAYMSFDRSDEADHSTVFGQPSAGHAFACVHPGELLYGSEAITPYYQTESTGLLDQFLSTEFTVWQDPAVNPTLETPFVKMPEWITARCTTENGFDYLEVGIDIGPDDPRSQTIGGEIFAGWGLHLVDMNLAMEELVELSQRQHQAWVNQP